MVLLGMKGGSDTKQQLVSLVLIFSFLRFCDIITKNLRLVLVYIYLERFVAHMKQPCSNHLKLDKVKS